MPTSKETLRANILDLVRQYHDEAFKPEPFEPGRSEVPYSGRVFGQEEIVNLVDSSLDFWLTAGTWAERFERSFASFFGLRHALLTNSGSSANLLAISALTSPKLGHKRINPGDEVITTAAGFPTTLNPILQNGLTPVFVDVEIPGYNADLSQLERALSDKTRAVFFAHTLGNVFDAQKVREFADERGLWFIEDCCDAVGSRLHGKLVGTFGDLATTSFYPAHHITMGEGGCVLTNNSKLGKIVKSYRDWGRDCWCSPGANNTCKKRFDWQLGEMPRGYDHKYTYSHIGYNLKITDMQAAIGVAQLERLPGFVTARRKNFDMLKEGLKDLEDLLILPEPAANSEPSWFGFPLMIREKAPISRERLIRKLEARKIATRVLFGGNLTRQPAYAGTRYRVAVDLDRSDEVMNRLFWVGLYPGLDKQRIEYMIDSLHQAARE
ncbi:MAG: lipopolysaccharide biosynthesis protein RfbH [Halieaceae bacterium]|jgi:CDP-4-dehydro-6-deoxyglucose reductase, E1|nr:lipopolysaccharide biosynthesis protein RfbH [Halieaceae bacterium]